MDKIAFIRGEDEIRMLILFVLCRLTEPVPIYVLTELSECDEGVTYFDVIDCVAKLTENNHLVCDPDGNYSLTQKGRRNGELLEENLPHSVKAKAEEIAKKIQKAAERNSLIKTTHTLDKTGFCNVSLTLSDGSGEILRVGLPCANEKQAEIIKKGFRIHAEEILRYIIETTTK